MERGTNGGDGTYPLAARGSSTYRLGSKAFRLLAVCVIAVCFVGFFKAPFFASVILSIPIVLNSIVHVSFGLRQSVAHVLILGVPSPRTIRTMWQVLRSERRGLFILKNVSVLFVVGVALSVLPKIGQPVMRRVIGISLLATAAAMLWKALIPPAILYLSASVGASANIQMGLKNRVWPLRVVSMIWATTDDKGGTKTVVLGPDMLRTPDGPDWRATVLLLMSAARLIVVDARSTSDGITQEINLILDNGIENKTAFIVAQGEIPAIDRGLTDRIMDKRHHAWLTEDTLIAQLPRLLSRQTPN
jgi:hypothetical protein